MDGRCRGDRILRATRTGRARETEAEPDPRGGRERRAWRTARTGLWRLFSLRPGRDPRPWTVKGPYLDRIDSRESRGVWSRHIHVNDEGAHPTPFGTESWIERRGSARQNVELSRVKVESRSDVVHWAMERLSELQSRKTGRRWDGKAGKGRRTYGTQCTVRRASERTTDAETEQTSAIRCFDAARKGRWTRLAACSAAALGALSFDQQTAQLLHRVVEVPLHDVLHEHTTAAWRTFWAGEVLSNYPIMAMLPVFLFQTATRLIGPASWSEKCLGGLGIAFYLIVAGYIPHHDVFVVQALKEYFMKERPISSPSFAFPSGHATAAAYLSGMLTFGMPIMSPASRSTPEVPAKFPAWSMEGLVQLSLHQGLWLVPVAAVASGRVLSERHWLGDTVAGACLGSWAVFTLLSIHEHLLRHYPRDA